MSHVIRINHPLDPESLGEGNDNAVFVQAIQVKILKNIFKFFWWDRVSNHFDMDPTEVLAGHHEIPCKGDGKSMLIQGHIKTLLNEKHLDELADKFACLVVHTIGHENITEISIRGFRSMVSRIFSKCVGAVIANNSDWINLVDPNKMVSIIKDIQQIASLK